MRAGRNKNAFGSAQQTFWAVEVWGRALRDLLRLLRG